MVVKGQNIIRIPFATVDDFRARPGLNGIPLLAPFANRLDEPAFYANGKKYNFDLELGNVRGPIPIGRFLFRSEGLEARRSQGGRHECVGHEQAGLLSQPTVDETVPVCAHTADDLPARRRRPRSQDAGSRISASNRCRWPSASIPTSS